MATLMDTPVSGFEQLASEDFSAYFARTAKLLKEMQAEADALPEGKYEGAILSFSIADGAALYLVHSTKPLKLKHIPYGDAYQIPYAHLRGINLADVQQQVARDKGFKKMFAAT